MRARYPDHFSDRLSAGADCALLRDRARVQLPTLRGSARDGRVALVRLPSVSELPRRAARRVFTFPGGWLIPSIAVVIGHATSSTVAIHELCRGRGSTAPARTASIGTMLAS